MSSPIPFPADEGGPEALFRLGQIYVDDGLLTGSMPVGPWLDGPDGVRSAGALGVLVDDVLGYAIFAVTPPDRWSVSTEITLDVFPALRTATGPLYAEGRMVHTDAIGGYATGRVTDETGAVVAACAQRGRLVPVGIGPAAGNDPAARVAVDVGDPADLAGLLGLTVDAAGTAALVVDARVANEMDNLHGGVSLAVSDLVARLALGDATTPGDPLVTASLHISYLRPVPAGSTMVFSATVRQRGRTTGLVDVEGRIGDRLCTSARVVALPLG